MRSMRASGTLPICLITNGPQHTISPLGSLQCLWTNKMTTASSHSIVYNSTRRNHNCLQRGQSKGHKGGRARGTKGAEQGPQRGPSKGHKGDRANGTKGTEQRAQRGQHRGDGTQGAAPKPELLLVASSLTPGSA